MGRDLLRVRQHPAAQQANSTAHHKHTAILTVGSTPCVHVGTSGFVSCPTTPKPPPASA